MIKRLDHAMLAVFGTACALLPSLSKAQEFDQYLSPTVPGYETVRGLQIAQRPRTEYDPLGIDAGEYTIRPELDESVVYDSNVLGTTPSVGSWGLTTAPTVSFNSNYGSANSIGGTLGLTDVRYFDQNRESHTDWNASLGGSFQIDQDTLKLAASEIYLHENPTDINSAALAQPLGFKVTDLRASYAFRFNLWQVTPNVEYTGYRFDHATLPDATLSQSYRDRDDVTGGVTIRFGRIPERSLVLVVQGTTSNYIASQGGQPRPNSNSVEALAGVDYSFSANLEVLLLVGYEIEQFINPAYPNISSPVAQASVVWAPSGLTTVTARLTRSIESSIGINTSGVTVTQGGITVDHEYKRNILLQGRFSAINSDFTGNQNQTIYNVGASISYLLNRNLRLTASYDFYQSSGNATNVLTTPTLQSTEASGNLLTTSANYSRHVALIGLRFTL